MDSATQETSPSSATTPLADGQEPARSGADHVSLGAHLRRTFDEFYLYFIIILFMKLFVVDIYSIPSGSMTPTLLGGRVARIDLDGDAVNDMVVKNAGEDSPLVYLSKDNRLLAAPNFKITHDQILCWDDEGRFHLENDKIIVNKLLYWLRPPRRGEIVVFKVPEAIYRPGAPIYVKRLVGEPGDQLSFDPVGHLIANGRTVNHPPFFSSQEYQSTIDMRVTDYRSLPEAVYEPNGAFGRHVEQITVPQGQAYVFGDNSAGSSDSRYWGGVPLTHFHGRAIARIWPLTHIGWLR